MNLSTLNREQLMEEIIYYYQYGKMLQPIVQDLNRKKAFYQNKWENAISPEEERHFERKKHRKILSWIISTLIMILILGRGYEVNWFLVVPFSVMFGRFLHFPIHFILKFILPDVEPNYTVDTLTVRADWKIKYEEDLVADEQFQLFNSLINESRYQNIDKQLPEQYKDFQSLEAIFNYLDNFRADNLKEAINLYQTEIHQATVVIQNSQLQEIQEKMERNLSELHDKFVPDK